MSSIWVLQNQLDQESKRYGLFDPTKPPPLWNVDGDTRDQRLGNRLFLGKPGSGKTSAVAYTLCETWENQKVPRLGIDGVKVMVLDAGRRSELGAAFMPMKDDHPLRWLLRAQKREPRGYPVEIFLPLSLSQGRPDITEPQPSIVRPFVFAIDELTDADWVLLLGIGESEAQKRLHRAAVAVERREGRLASDTVGNLIEVAEDLAISGNYGRSLNLEGAEDLPPVVSHRAHSAKELTGLVSAYESLNDSGLVLPKRFFGKETPWLDMRAVLRDNGSISVFHIPPNDLDRSRHAKVFGVLLNMIVRQKRLDNPNRVKLPVMIGIPELANLAKKSPLPDERAYLAPLKDLVFSLFRTGQGEGISLVCDTQWLRGEHGLNDIINETSNALGLFDIGRSEVKEQLAERSVVNRKDFDDYTLSRLRRQGSFVWIGPGSSYAEMLAGACPRFNYPRVRLGSKMSEFTYVDLWRSAYPPSNPANAGRWTDPRELYALVREIMVSGHLRAVSLAKEKEARRDEEESGENPEGTKPEAHGPSLGKVFVERLRALEGLYNGQKTAEVTTLQLCESLKLDRRVVGKFEDALRRKGLAIILTTGHKRRVVIDMEKLRRLTSP